MHVMFQDQGRFLRDPNAAAACDYNADNFVFYYMILLIPW